MASSSGAGGASGSTPPWTAMAFFVATVLASQVLQHFLNDNHSTSTSTSTSSNAHEDDDEDNDQDARYYAREQSLPERFDRYTWMRRRHDRLSFDHIDMADLSERNQRTLKTASSTTSQQQQQQQSAPPIPYIPGNKRLSVAANDMDRRNEQDNEFLPKNFNWSHFERANDEDVQGKDDNNNESKEMPMPRQLKQPQLQQLAPKNESGYSEADEADSKEQFVWTAPPNRSSFHQQAESASEHQRSSEMSSSFHRRFAPPEKLPSNEQGCGKKIKSGTGRRRSLPCSEPRNDRKTTAQLLGDIPPPKNLRRRTISYPNYVPLKRFRRIFSLESSDDGDLDGVSDEDDRTEENDDGEENAALFRSMNREARARYNARIMPSKVVLIRHGQSMGNIDEFLYATTPDNAMPLTKLGWEQARYTGRVLREQVLASESNEPVHFIVSPYVRTVETFHGIVSAWCDPAEFSHIENRDERLTAWYEALVARGLTWHEDPRIREQDFGNYQDPETIKRAKQERHRFGVFYYRFPHGESASDVFDRVSTFLDSLWRSFDFNQSRNYVLITHGISIRVFLARYFRYTIDQFSMLHNPRNCEMVILGHDGAGKLNLEGRCDLEMKENDKTHELEVVGHKFHKRLRVVPQKSVRKVKIRISYDDDT